MGQEIPCPDHDQGDKAEQGWVGWYPVLALARVDGVGLGRVPCLGPGQEGTGWVEQGRAGDYPVLVLVRGTGQG